MFIIHLSQIILDKIQNCILAKSAHLEAAYLKGLMYYKTNWYLKEYLPNILETTLLPRFFVFEVRDLRSSPKTQFWKRVLNLNSELTCTVVNWDIVTDLWQLYYYFRSGKKEYNNYFLAFTVVIQLPQISYYDPFNHCAGPIWVQIQNPWSKQIYG